ncbi:hypothetical protein SAMN05216505_102233 [Streptomyces prasinopilosus]|uniref:Uncharacterized protein n=1 Tax=Streptomyces prasinopilosus TaxID=67344 RepID=A0A1G6LRC1_9ACTN|nr:hypothetical protein SAMN05216505_102233 [Streptomyces prasinopilosus]
MPPDGSGGHRGARRVLGEADPVHPPVSYGTAADAMEPVTAARVVPPAPELPVTGESAPRSR